MLSETAVVVMNMDAFSVKLFYFNLCVRAFKFKGTSKKCQFMQSLLYDGETHFLFMWHVQTKKDLFNKVMCEQESTEQNYAKPRCHNDSC